MVLPLVLSVYPFWMGFKPIFVLLLNFYHFWAIFHYHGPLHKNHSLSVVYGSITLKFFLWPLDTHSHQWFEERSEIQKKCFLGHPNLQVSSRLSINLSHFFISFDLVLSWYFWSWGKYNQVKTVCLNRKKTFIDKAIRF